MAPQSVWRVTESTRRRAKARRLAIPQAGRGHSNAEVGGSGRKSSPPRTQGLGATERWRARRVDRSEMEARRLAVACGRRRVRRGEVARALHGGVRAATSWREGRAIRQRRRAKGWRRASDELSREPRPPRLSIRPAGSKRSDVPRGEARQRGVAAAVRKKRASCSEWLARRRGAKRRCSRLGKGRARARVRE